MAVRGVDSPVWRCPSSPATGRGYSDYAGVHNGREAPIDVDNNGVFFLNSDVRNKDLLDGASHTLIIGEKRTLSGDLGWLSGTRSTLRNMGTTLGISGMAGPFALTAPPGVADVVWPAAPEGEGLLAALFGGPQYTNAGQQDNSGGFVRPTKPLLAVGGFGSAHPGGTNFAAGDGSVRFVSNSIAPSIYQDLGNRADRNLIQAEF